MSSNESIQLCEHAVAVVDQDLVVVEWNAAAERLYGVAVNEAVGRPLLQAVGCDGLSRDELLRAVEEHGQWQGTADHRGAGGRPLAVSWLVYRLNSHCYDRQGIVAVARPAARAEDAALSEASLDDQQILLRTLVDHLPHYIYVKDVRGRTLLANQALSSYLGHEDPEQLVGSTDFDTYPVDQAQRYHDCEQDIIRAGIPMIGREAEILHGDGQRRHVLSTKVPFRDSGGEVIGLVGLAVDVTAQKEAEQQQRRMEQYLAQAKKMEAVGRLAGGVAHDFNNILTAIMGYTDIALLTAVPGSQLQADLTEVKEAVRQAGRLTQQLQALSRRQAISSRVLDLNAEIRLSQTMLGRLLGQQIELRFVPQEGPCLIEADSGLLEQMLANLSVYAREALPEGGTLTLETANLEPGAARLPPASVLNTDDVVLLTVHDDGPGMDPGTLSQVFEPSPGAGGGRAGPGHRLRGGDPVRRLHRGRVQPRPGGHLPHLLPCGRRGRGSHGAAHRRGACGADERGRDGAVGGRRGSHPALAASGPGAPGLPRAGG